jgi:hypothetical protein
LTFSGTFLSFARQPGAVIGEAECRAGEEAIHAFARFG